MVRDISRVITRDGHKLGLFVSAAMPIFTLAELFQDHRPKLPPLISPNRLAARIKTRGGHRAGAQAGLNL